MRGLGCAGFHHEHHHHKRSACIKLFFAIKFILSVLILGIGIGLLGLYLMDRDKTIKAKARKMFKNIECFSDDIKNKIHSTM